MKGNEITMTQHKVKAVFCKCGKGIFYVAVLPHAETDKECRRTFAKYAKEGYRIDYVSSDEMKEKFYKCDCYEKNKTKKEPGLFDE